MTGTDKPLWIVRGNDRADPNTGNGEEFEIEVRARTEQAAETVARRERAAAGRHHVLVGEVRLA